MSVQSVLEGSSRWTVINGEAECILPQIPDNTVHAIICDPPASIKFMGKEWDSDKGGRDQWVAWLTNIMREAWRVTRPGGYAMVWALPRRSHWTAWAVESAGWAIGDIVEHMFGTGMPKGFLKSKEWEGWGTGLKPVREHWIVARKPLAESSTTGNLDEWETGALHIDACRVGTNAGWSYPKGRGGSGIWENVSQGTSMSMAQNLSKPVKATKGRWPPHLVLSHAPGCEMSGTKKVKTGKAHRSKSGGKNFGSETRAKPKMDDMTYADADGMEEVEDWTCVPGCPVGLLMPHARFWPTFRYEPKASIAEKNKGCEDMPPRDWREGTKSSTPRSGQLFEHVGRKGKDRPNNHPCAKPVQFMRWLIRLACIEYGVVLDPFNGSGTTGVACMLEGMRYVGVEQDAYYCTISERRITAECAELGLDVSASPRRRPHVMDGFR